MIIHPFGLITGIPFFIFTLLKDLRLSTMARVKDFVRMVLAFAKGEEILTRGCRILKVQIQSSYCSRCIGKIMRDGMILHQESFLLKLTLYQQGKK